MSHPYAKHKNLHKERVGRMMKGYGGAAKACGGRAYKRGGAVHEDATEDRKLIKKVLDEEHIHGKRSRGGALKRASGGRTKAKGTNININVGTPPGGGMRPPMPMPMPAPMARPPMPAPGAAPPGAGAPPGIVPPGAGGAPPMMPRARGGRAVDGPAWREGLRNGTTVKNSPGKDLSNKLKPPYPITRARGGRADYGDEGKSTSRGRTNYGEEAKSIVPGRHDYGEKVMVRPKISGGPRGGLGRMMKAREQRKVYP